MKKICFFAFLHILCSHIYALQSSTLQVLRVIDGDSIVVEGSAGGVAVPISIRLKYIDTPEMRDGKKENPYGQQAKDCLSALVQKGSKVQLFTNKKYFSADSHGRVLAIVYTLDKNGKKVCLQEHMISHGMSVYWTKFGTNTRHNTQWQALEKQAELHANGLWLHQRAWMLEKRTE